MDTDGGMRSRRAEGAGGAGLAGRAGLPRKAGRRLLASGTGAGCGGQSLLKTPPIWEDQRALYGGGAASAALTARLPAFACAPGLEAGEHCALAARAP